MELTDEVIQLPPILFSRLKFGFFEKSELTPPQFAVLMNLKLQDTPMRMTDLAKKLRTSMPTMTGIVSRLVKRGFVKRGIHPSDRRVVTVEITMKGKQASEGLTEAIRNVWTPVILNLDHHEQIQFLSLIKKIKKLFLAGGA